MMWFGLLIGSFLVSLTGACGCVCVCVGGRCGSLHVCSAKTSGFHPAINGSYGSVLQPSSLSHCWFDVIYYSAVRLIPKRSKFSHVFFLLFVVVGLITTNYNQEPLSARKSRRPRLVVFPDSRRPCGLSQAPTLCCDAKSRKKSSVSSKVSLGWSRQTGLHVSQLTLQPCS